MSAVELGNDAALIKKELYPAKRALELLGLLEGARRQGDGFMIRCPGHDDRNPSCSVQDREGTVLFNCHANCGFKGDVMNAIAVIHKLDDYPEVCRRGLELAGRTPPSSSMGPSASAPPSPASSPAREGVPGSALPDSSPVYDALLALCPLEGDVLEYLDGRRLGDLARADGWGALPPPKGQGRIVAALEEQFVRPQLCASGLFGKKDGFLRVQHRILIPWRAPDGRISVLQRRLPRDGFEKYILPKGRPVLYPYGIECLEDSDATIVIVEGAADVLALRELDRERHHERRIVLGLPGKVMRPEWFKLCRGRRVFVATDADEEGEQAVSLIVAGAWNAGALEVFRERPSKKDWAKIFEIPPELRKGDAIATVEAMSRGSEGKGIEMDERPPIDVYPDKINDAADSLCALLPAMGDVYQQTNARLVHVVALERDVKTNRGRIRVAVGSPIIVEVTKAGLLERACRVAGWRKPDGRSQNRLFPCTPPDSVINAVIDRRVWPGVPWLMGVSEIPVLRPDGSIHETPGYDPKTGYYYQPSGPLPPMRAAPTLDDARRGLEILNDAFVDFPWASAAAKSIPIAAILTLMALSAINGSVPLIAFEANTPGTGKSLAADIVAIVATGRSAPRSTFSTDAAELEKTLAGIALCGASFVLFDNVGSGVPLRGDALDKVLTATETVRLRVLGTNDFPALPWKVLIIVTGNNLTIGSDDMRRRTLLGRLDSRYENPEKRPLRDFQHPERAGRLIQWAKENRAELVCAAFDVLRAYLLAGAPQALEKTGDAGWGSFESWQRLVDGAIVWAGGSSPLGGKPEGDTNPERGATATLLKFIQRIDDGSGVTVAKLVNVLYSPDYISGREAPDTIKIEARSAVEELVRLERGSPDKRALGTKLRAIRGRTIDGIRLERRKFVNEKGDVRETDSNGVVHWKVLRAVDAPD